MHSPKLQQIGRLATETDMVVLNVSPKLFYGILFKKPNFNFIYHKFFLHTKTDMFPLKQTHFVCSYLPLHPFLFPPLLLPIHHAERV